MVESQALARNGNGELALRNDTGPGFALSFREMRERVIALNEFYQGVMQEGTDYGVIPGTPKPSLFQPGAQLLDGIFGLVPTFEEMPSTYRDFDRGFFSIDIRCRLISKASGEVAAEGLGHCNSKEDKYRWRSSKRSCPSCGEEAIIQGKPEYGGGWICFARKGGCGAKFKIDDASIVSQKEGRVENDDTYTLVNTISKMAQKRAHVAATLNATGASRIFTQDVEDLPAAHLAQEPPRAQTAPPIAVSRPAAPEPLRTVTEGGLTYVQEAEPAVMRAETEPPEDEIEAIQRVMDAPPVSRLWPQVHRMRERLDEAKLSYTLPPQTQDDSFIADWLTRCQRELDQQRRAQQAARPGR